MQRSHECPMLFVLIRVGDSFDFLKDEQPK